MDKQTEKCLFEQFGFSNLSKLREQLLDEMKYALSSEEEDLDFMNCVDINEFARKVFAETRLNRVFWLNSKKHFFGNEEILNFINSRSKVLNPLCLEFLREKYWTIDCNCPSRKDNSSNVYSENLTFGLLGEEMLLKHLNEIDNTYFFVNSGKLLLQSIPCFGATPDFLVLRRNTVSERLPSMYQYVQRASAIAELKTTQTPEDFKQAGKGFAEEDLHGLLKSVYKNRHIVLGSSKSRPDVFNVTKKFQPKVNWLTSGLLMKLVESYEESCRISVYRFDERRWYQFGFNDFKNRPYVNFLTSSRGKQLLGQCLVFCDNRSDLDQVELFVFYLFLSRQEEVEEKEERKPEYLMKIRCCVPNSVLKHIAKELNVKFYRQYYELCYAPSKSEAISPSSTHENQTKSTF
jgi:hypothetical protein